MEEKKLFPQDAVVQRGSSQPPKSQSDASEYTTNYGMLAVHEHVLEPPQSSVKVWTCIMSELQLKSTGKCFNNASCQILNVLPEYSEKLFTACKGKLYILP